MGGLESWVTVDGQSGPSLWSVDILWSISRVRSSRRGNEMVRLRTCEGGRVIKYRWRDLMKGENSWNGTREVESGPPAPYTARCATREKPLIQPPASASAAVTTWRQPMNRILVYRAGEVEGSGNISFHVCRHSTVMILTSKKRCFRARGTHDLETRQQLLRTRSALYRRSTT